MAAKSTHGIKNHTTITSMERGHAPLVQDLSGKRLEALQKTIQDHIDNKKPSKYSEYYDKTPRRGGRPSRKSYKRKSYKRKSYKRKSYKRKSYKRKSYKRKSYRHF